MSPGEVVQEGRRERGGGQAQAPAHPWSPGDSLEGGRNHREDGWSRRPWWSLSRGCWGATERTRRKEAPRRDNAQEVKPT